MDEAMLRVTRQARSAPVWASFSHAIATRRGRAAASLRTADLVQSRGNRDGRPILSPGELKEMGYRGCIDAQLMLGAAVHFVERAVHEMVETGSYTGLTDAEFTELRKNIEDLIGLDAYYRIEAETVDPDSAVR
jgi:hypothetical protein